MLLPISKSVPHSASLIVQIKIGDRPHYDFERLPTIFIVSKFLIENKV